MRHVQRYRDAHASVFRLDEKVLELANAPHLAAAMERLRTIPGIGLVTAAILMTEIGDPSRFRTTGSLGHYAARTPSEYSTGLAANRKGHITKCGNAWIRTALVEAAWTLVRKDADAARRFARIRERKGAKIAITAVARWMSTVVFAMLRDGRNYAEVVKAAA